MFGLAYFKAYDDHGELVYRSRNMPIGDCKNQARWWYEDYGDRVYVFYTSTEAMIPNIVIG